MTALEIISVLWTVAAFFLCLCLCAAAARPAPAFKTTEGPAIKSRELPAPVVAGEKDPAFCFSSGLHYRAGPR